MLDVSDGLVGDLNHLCAVSGVGAVLEAARVPESPAVREALARDPALLALLLGGGDDYDLGFSAPNAAEAAPAALATSLPLPITAIGRLRAGEAGRVISFNAWKLS